MIDDKINMVIEITTNDMVDESLPTFFDSSLVSLGNFVGWHAGSQYPSWPEIYSPDSSTFVEHQASVSLSDQLKVQLLNVTPSNLNGKMQALLDFLPLTVVHVVLLLVM